MNQSEKTIQIYIREVLNLPYQPHETNFCNSKFILGWTLYGNTEPDPRHTKSSSTSRNQLNPKFNEGIEIILPNYLSENQGFIYFSLISNQSDKKIIDTYFPITNIPNFHPINLKVHVGNHEQTQVGLSIIKQDIYSKFYNDDLIKINLTNFEASPYFQKKQYF